jgi:formylglycine-generating enzyme required for sulfatase activity
VHITKAFWMGIYEVTNAQFEAFIQATGYATDAEKRGAAFGWDEAKGQFGMVKGLNWRNPKTPPKNTEGPFGDLPVCHMSWNDAMAFCDWASKVSNENITLPTEAQWEFACRAGTTTAYWWGQSVDDVCQYANVLNAEYKGSTGYATDLQYFPCKDNFMCRAPVGQFQPNALGLYDMTGNLWEWCSDWYSKEYFKDSPRDDPKGPETGTERSLRGGGWGGRPYFISNARVARRAPHTPAAAPYPLGFRVISTAEK